MSPAKPTLALCIPAYNAAGFLSRLLDSAKSQTEPFDEIWVYDDASKDNTADLALGLGAQVIRGKANAGCPHGKNTLAKASKCDWIHFHDADDVLEPNFVAAARSWMARPDCPDVVLFSYRAVDDRTGEHLYVRVFDAEALASNAVAYCIREQINPFSGIYRRTRFLECGGWDEDPAVLASEDQAGHMRMALAGLRFAADPTVTVINHIRTGSMSDTVSARCPSADYHFIEKGWRIAAPQLRPAFARRLWKVAGSAGAFLDWATADKCVALAKQLDPNATIDGSSAFGALARLAPRLALRLRERWIRLVRPQLRSKRQYHPNRAP
jgi:glycosyltransferase involved in cell wall biosynthesis